MKQLYAILLVCFSGSLFAQTPHPIDWCTVVVQGNTLNSDDYFLRAPHCIKDELNETNVLKWPEHFTDVDWKAGNEIFLNGEVELEATSARQAHLRIEQPDFEVVWIESNNSPAFANQNEKMEFGIKLPDALTAQVDNYLAGLPHGGINPYNPNEILVQAVFRHESGLSITRDGFYYQQYFESVDELNYLALPTMYPWRVRFAPEKSGSWKVGLRILLNGVESLHVRDIPFECIPNNRKGRVKKIDSPERSYNQRFLTYSNSNETFFAIGMNTAWTHVALNSGGLDFTPKDNHRHEDWITRLKAQGANYCSINTNYANFAPEWPVIDNYQGRQENLWALDRIFDRLEEEEMYTQLHLELHDQLIDQSEGGQWHINPYHNQLADVNNATDFFDKPSAIDMFKRKLRYINARYGYSPQIAILELFSEVGLKYDEYTNSNTNTAEPDILRFNNWFIEMRDFLKNDLGMKQLISASSASDNDTKNTGNKFYELADVTLIHKYGDLKNENYKTRWETIKKFQQNRDLRFNPIIYDELGIGGDNNALYCCTSIDFHNNIWASSFMGTFGSGQHWWWDRGILDNGYENHLRPLANFFDGESLHTMKYKHYRWKDRGGTNRMKRTRLEAFYMVSENGDRAIGWAHNATAYWRNLAPTNQCVQDLVDQKYSNNPCTLEDGVLQAHQGGVQSGTDFSDPLYEDENTSDGIIKVTGPDKKIEIKNLRYNPVFFDRPTYRVTWYRTSTGSLDHEIAHQETLNTNSFSRTLEIQFPKTNDFGNQENDYSFKVEFIGFNRSVQQDSLPLPKSVQATSKEEKTIWVYPNPTSEVLNIVSSTELLKIEIYNLSGKQVYTKSVNELLSIAINMHDFKKGMYLVRVHTSQGTYSEKLIIE